MRMNPKTLLPRNFTWNCGIYRLCARRCYSSDPFKEEILDISMIDVTPQFLEEITEREREEIKRKRNKSRLNSEHRNMIHETRPYDENVAWFHTTIKYKQRTLGKYGVDALDVPVGALWPTKEEIEDKLLIEKTAYPLSIQERWKEIEERRRQEEEAIRIREEKITKNLAMVGKWRKDLFAKIAQKEAVINTAKERKARLMEEVRRQFGFNIDPHDERFKTLLEQREKQEKKLRKEAKKKERAAKFIAQMLEKTKSDDSVDSAESKPEAEKKTEGKEKES